MSSALVHPEFTEMNKALLPLLVNKTYLAIWWYDFVSSYIENTGDDDLLFEMQEIYENKLIQFQGIKK